MDWDDVQENAVGMVAPDGPAPVTPDLDDVQQQEPDVPALDVDVKGPVQVHLLPARVAVMHNIVVGTSVVQLAGRDLRRARALVWTAPADTSAVPGQSVSDYGTVTVNASSSVGDVAAQIAAGSLPSGRYRIDAYTTVVDTTSPAAFDLLQIEAGGTAVARIQNINAVASAGYPAKTPVTLYAELDGTESVAVTVAAVETGSNEQVFNVVLVATRVAAAADASAVHLGTRPDEVDSGTAARLAVGERLELRHCEPLYVRTESGSVTVSYLLEQWAD